MELLQIRILFDTGMLILIWMVQLIVYPSFKYYTNTSLLLWHKKYSSRLAIIVIPLMFGQLIIAVLQLINLVNYNSLIYALLISALWAITFIIFVPLHSKIASSKSNSETLNTLIISNWVRTVLWSLVFVISVLTEVLN